MSTADAADNIRRVQSQIKAGKQLTKASSVLMCVCVWGGGNGKWLKCSPNITYGVYIILHFINKCSVVSLVADMLSLKHH